jgi:glycosyltransferase involved in cell wall biosynthesis
MQEYTNFHVVFIDDASTDGTGDQVQAYMESNQTRITPDRYTIIKNA